MLISDTGFDGSICPAPSYRMLTAELPLPTATFGRGGGGLSCLGRACGPVTPGKPSSAGTWEGSTMEALLESEPGVYCNESVLLRCLAGVCDLMEGRKANLLDSRSAARTPVSHRAEQKATGGSRSAWPHAFLSRDMPPKLCTAVQSMTQFVRCETLGQEPKTRR